VISTVRLIRFIWFLTLLAFFGAIFLCYFQWTDPVAVHFDTKGEPIIFLDKSLLFYIVCMVMISYNVVILLLSTAFTRVPLDKFPIPNKSFWLENKQKTDYLRHIISSWIYAFTSILNIIFIIFIIMLTYANIDQFDMRKPISTFSFISPLFFGTSLLFIIYALVRLRIKKVSISEK
jgi:hypothetical protein